MFFSLLCLQWTCSNKACKDESADIDVPIQYWNSSSEKISLKVKRIKTRDLNVPVVVLTNGLGKSNVELNLTKYTTLFKDTNFYFVGYRGTDSNVTFERRAISKIVFNRKDKISEKDLIKAAEKSEKTMNISDYWIPQRARDVIEFMDQEGIKQVNILAVGSTGSLIAQQLMSDFPEKLIRVAIVNSAVASNDNHESVLTLFEKYKRLCAAESNEVCPYKDIEFLPEKLPERVLLTNTVKEGAIRWITDIQLREPEKIQFIFDNVYQVSKGSSIAINSIQSTPNIDMTHYNWIDVAMHICADPTDSSFLAPIGLDGICQYIPRQKLEIKNNFTTPLLLVDGELDLPSERMVVSFYNNHTSPENQKLITRAYLPKSSSQYELTRIDVASAIEMFLSRGAKKFNIRRDVKIVWKTLFSVTKVMKYAYVVGFVFVTGIAALSMYSSYKEQKKNQKGKKRIVRKHQVAKTVTNEEVTVDSVNAIETPLPTDVHQTKKKVVRKRKLNEKNKE